jgi:hypothetical protein
MAAVFAKSDQAPAKKVVWNVLFVAELDDVTPGNHAFQETHAVTYQRQCTSMGMLGLSSLSMHSPTTKKNTSLKKVSVYT